MRPGPQGCEDAYTRVLLATYRCCVLGRMCTNECLSIVDFWVCTSCGHVRILPMAHLLRVLVEGKTKYHGALQEAML